MFVDSYPTVLKKWLTEIQYFSTSLCTLVSFVIYIVCSLFLKNKDAFKILVWNIALLILMVHHNKADPLNFRSGCTWSQPTCVSASCCLSLLGSVRMNGATPTPVTPTQTRWRISLQLWTVCGLPSDPSCSKVQYLITWWEQE